MQYLARARLHAFSKEIHWRSTHEYVGAYRKLSCFVHLENTCGPSPCNLTELTDHCYRAVADKTLDEQAVVDILQRVDREICLKLTDSIISKHAKQHIMKATTDTEALHLLIQVRCIAG